MELKFEGYEPIKIPNQLKDFNYRFCRVRYKTKVPYEKAWQLLEKDYERQKDKSWKNKETGELYKVTKKGEKEKVIYYGELHNYDWDVIGEHLMRTEANYGVLTGLNELAVLDDDTEDNKLMKIALESFGETFRVRDHLYFKLKDWDGKKIIFYDSTGKHMGELQGKGAMVVGAFSVHPSGETYDIKNNIPIKEIDVEIFKSIFQDYIKEFKKPPLKQLAINFPTWEGEDVKEIPITNVISLSGLMDMGDGCYQGSHIIHGSTGGMNFRVDTNNNTWYCFRCSSGGSSPELIAVVEGIIDCSQAGKGCLAGDKGSQVIQIAREKYGLKAPEIKEPRGWALSINIKRMATKYNLINCPKCNIPFLFREDTGFYRCSNCKMSGGLKRFALLCYNSK